MKNPDSVADVALQVSAARRKMLKVAAVGAGLSLLPGANALAGAVAVSKPPVSLLPSVQVGFRALGSSTIVDAAGFRGSSGTYELSVIGVGTKSPFALAAQYSSIASHRFWQAWREQGMLQTSAPITIRWMASGGNALPINITLAEGTLTAAITARPGIYVLSITPANQAVPAWSSLAFGLHRGGSALTLVPKGSSTEVATTYALFEVDRV